MQIIGGGPCPPPPIPTGLLTQKNSDKFLGFVICTVYLLNYVELYGV